MNHVVHALACIAHGCEVDDIGFTELDLRRKIVEIVAFARTEVVDSAHLFATANQFARNVGADESSHSCNQIESHIPL